MSYVRDNGLDRARRRRERRSVAILGLCALIVVGAIVFAVTFMSSTSKKGACAGQTQSASPASAFTLNVYNGGGQKGAASAASEALHTHELRIGVVGNDPYRKSISGVGEIRFGPDGAAKARQFVAKLVPGATLVQDGRDGTSVDVVVGPTFPTITKAAPKPTPSSTCR